MRVQVLRALTADPAREVLWVGVECNCMWLRHYLHVTSHMYLSMSRHTHVSVRRWLDVGAGSISYFSASFCMIASDLAHGGRFASQTRWWDTSVVEHGKLTLAPL